VVEAWSSILHKVKNAKLFLKSKQLTDPAQREEVKHRFSQLGIAPERLILEESESRKAYFEAYQRIDLVLDTFPYPGGTTSVDALWMGVPVLTLKGDRFLSHLGESIAINAGQANWIASSADDYVNKAVQFTSDFEQLALLRASLRERVLRSPLFDTPRFAQHFAEAIQGIWRHQVTIPRQ
jgi:protein O-GlcNAc transferase